MNKVCWSNDLRFPMAMPVLRDAMATDYRPIKKIPVDKSARRGLKPRAVSPKEPSISVVFYTFPLLQLLFGVIQLISKLSDTVHQIYDFQLQLCSVELLVNGD